MCVQGQGDLNHARVCPEWGLDPDCMGCDELDEHGEINKDNLETVMKVDNNCLPSPRPFFAMGSPPRANKPGKPLFGNGEHLATVGQH